MSKNHTNAAIAAAAQPAISAGSYQILSNFLPSFGYSGLSVLLGRAESTLQADKCRAPWKLPPACTPPGSKSPIWRLVDVLEWLEDHRQAVTPPPAATPNSTLEGRRRVGRPTKVEQLARDQLLRDPVIPLASPAPEAPPTAAPAKHLTIDFIDSKTGEERGEK